MVKVFGSNDPHSGNLVEHEAVPWLDYKTRWIQRHTFVVQPVRQFARWVPDAGPDWPREARSMSGSVLGVARRTRRRWAAAR